MSVDPRRTQPFCTPRCFRECRCSRWPNMLNRFGWPVRPGQEYYEKVLSYGPIAYWPLWEAGGVVAHCLVNAAQDGTYSSPVGTWPVGDGIGDGNTAPQFDGVNDFANVLTPTFATNLNGSEGTAMAWARMANLGTWTDGLQHTIFYILDNTDFNEWVLLYKHANNTLRWYYSAGGVIELVALGGLTTIDWMHIAITWSASAGINGEVRAYYNGVQTGLTQTALGVWAGPITRAFIGSQSAAPAVPWYGSIAHVVIFDRAATAAEIATFATVP